MGFFRRDGRLRPGTLWIVFVVALLLGAAAGWAYGWWSHRSIGEHALDAEKAVKRSLDKVTK